MPTMYKVVGHAAHATLEGPNGRVRQLLFKGQLLPPDTPQQEIDHLLSVKLIAPITLPDPEPAPEPAAEPGTDASEPDTGQPPAGEGGPDTGQPPAAEPAPAAEPSPAAAAAADGEAQRADARAKLDAAGGKPTGRHGQPVWVEHLVNLGYDFTAVAKLSKDELQKLAEQVQR